MATITNVFANQPATKPVAPAPTGTANLGGWGALPDYSKGGAPAAPAPSPAPAPAPRPPSGGTDPFVIGGSSSGSSSTGAPAPAPAPGTAPIFSTPSAPAAPKPLTLDPNSSVNNQLTSILAKDSPLIQLARTRAAQAANDRGLLNSSIGVQAGEVAALDAALPIAQQDAQTVGQKDTFNAEQSNIFARDENNFQREAALKDKDQSFQASQDTLAFTRQLEAMGYQSKLSQSQLPQQFIAGVSQQAQAGVQAILADPTLKPDAKQNAIKNLVDYSNATLEWAEKFYGIQTPDLPGGNPTSGNPAAPGVVPK